MGIREVYQSYLVRLLGSIFNGLWGDNCLTKNLNFDNYLV